jgi:adenylate cyclase
MELDSTLYEAAWYYARSLQAQGNIEQALVYYERAAALRVDDVQAPIFAAICYRTLGRHDEEKAAEERGLAATERALALNPNDSRALYLGAAALDSRGDKAKAEEWARRASQSDPTNPLMLYNLGCFYATRGDRGLALDHLERAMEVGMRNLDWFMTDPDLDSVRGDPRFKALLQQ